MSNKWNSVLYSGVTNNLRRRIAEHKQMRPGSFTARYNITKLVYFEIFNDPRDAIRREKQVKAGPRKQKQELIESINPKYNDLLLEL
ncbi:MAG: GIY-YIG nuclease family protein [Candidatus Edwardsbacteria bacterium]|nr:GIY-YIG nuclease family protein [Candidatus Edwardsbacteria bacterium]MBU1576255.1 GIY-YIG nuclease family protein [Candidatus Edwardsbacteria bacterium]MBU2462654.1 GIY-YIG nuclease family protein [Candidatus Edwardsbacteria bacterium]MBU2594437.1 GIY-YIG nuclease family protein [Candidatus Edwardsbacteria bacterium]